MCILRFRHTWPILTPNHPPEVRAKGRFLAEYGRYYRPSPNRAVLGPYQTRLLPYSAHTKATIPNGIADPLPMGTLSAGHYPNWAAMIVNVTANVIMQMSKKNNALYSAGFVSTVCTLAPH